MSKKLFNKAVQFSLIAAMLLTFVLPVQASLTANKQTITAASLISADYVKGFDVLDMKYCISTMTDITSNFIIQFKFSNGGELGNTVSFGGGSLTFSGNSPSVTLSGAFGAGGSQGDTQVAFLVQPTVAVPIVDNDCIFLSHANDSLKIPQNTGSGTVQLTVKVTNASATVDINPTRTVGLVEIQAASPPASPPASAPASIYRVDFGVWTGLVFSIGALGGVAAIIRRRRKKVHRLD